MVHNKRFDLPNQRAKDGRSWQTGRRRGGVNSLPGEPTNALSCQQERGAGSRRDFCCTGQSGQG